LKKKKVIAQDTKQKKERKERDEELYQTFPKQTQFKFFSFSLSLNVSFSHPFISQQKKKIYKKNF